MSSAIRNSVKTIILVLLTVLGCKIQAQGIALPKTYTTAEVDEIDLPIKLIDIRDGLSQGLISSIAQDSVGYLWLGTKDGLNRYDGYGFKVFRHDPQNPLSIRGNDVRALLVDSKGQIWVATSNGLDLFDPGTETFHHFPDIDHEETGFQYSAPSMLLELADGNMMARTLHSRFWSVIVPATQHANLGTATYRIEKFEDIYPSLSDSTQDNLMGYLANVGKDGSLWIRRANSVCRFRPEALAQGLAPSCYDAPGPDRIGSLEGPGRFAQHGPDGSVYLASIDTLYKFDEGADRFVPFLTLPAGHQAPTTTLIDRQNRLWIKLANFEFLRIDLNTQQLTLLKFTGNRDVLGAIRAVRMVFEDRQHNIWLSTSGMGVLKISARTDLFKSLPSNFPKMKDNYWLPRGATTSNKALFDRTIQKRWLSLRENFQFGFPSWEFPSFVSPLSVDDHGKFWGTCYERHDEHNLTLHIFSVDTATGAITIQAQMADHYAPGKPEIAYPLIPDKGNHLWFGDAAHTDNSSFFHMDTETGTLTKIPYPCQVKAQGYPMVFDWSFANDGGMWLGTMMGLMRFDRKTYEWQHFQASPGEKGKLSAQMVFCVQSDPRAPDRYLWLGTNGGGLNCFDIKHQRFTHWTTDDGLPNNVVYAIQFDAHHNLWLSTNNGLCRFDPLKGEMRNFTSQDGLVDNEFNRYEFSQSARGELYFGGVNGTSYFNPEDFYKKAEPSHLVIHALKLDNKPVIFKTSGDPNATGFQLSAPMASTKELVFEHDHKMIGIGFALLDLTVPKLNKFRYRLRSYNEEWIDAGTSTEAIYTNLSPGSYTFEVIGCNSRNIWNTSPTTLAIVIRPPWWGTWWFRVLVILLVSALIYAAYYYRLQQALKVERMRNRIGQDLHDEIGSTLSSISLYSAVMQKSSDQLPPQTINILDKIISSTSQMMESMNDMVWTIKASNDSFEQVIHRMRAFAVNMTEAQAIKMIFEVDPQVEKLLFGMEQRKNLYLIYKEAVNNAAKYARCTELTIELKKVAGFLQLVVKDNGIGFDLEDKSARDQLLGGNGLAGMRARAEAIGAEIELQSALGKGTELRLALAI